MVSADLTGQKFNKLSVESFAKKDKRGKYWNCICECGRKSVVIGTKLTTGATKSCGDCVRIRNWIGEIVKGFKIIEKLEFLDGVQYWNGQCENCFSEQKLSSIQLGSSFHKCFCQRMSDLIDKKFDRLKVVEVFCRTKIKCLCDCGNTVYAKAYPLIHGTTRSCGCLTSELLKSKRGKDHYLWKHDLSEENRSERYRRGVLHERWKSEIKRRDNFTCQITGKKDEKLTAHHLNSFADFPKERYDVNNGILICENIHKLFHKLYGRGNNTREQFEEFKKLWEKHGELLYWYIIFTKKATQKMKKEGITVTDALEASVRISDVLMIFNGINFDAVEEMIVKTPEHLKSEITYSIYLLMKEFHEKLNDIYNKNPGNQETFKESNE